MLIMFWGCLRLSMLKRYKTVYYRFDLISQCCVRVRVRVCHLIETCSQDLPAGAQLYFKSE